MSFTCESCGARVRWVLTKTGKGPLIARVLAKGEHVDVLTSRFKSHFATCPNAAQHRRK